MKFKVWDSTEISAKSPTMNRVEAYLRRMPPGKLLTTTALVEATGLNHGNFVSNVRAYISAELCTRALHGNVKLYGNPETVRAWKKEHQL